MTWQAKGGRVSGFGVCLGFSLSEDSEDMYRLESLIHCINSFELPEASWCASTGQLRIIFIRVDRRYVLLFALVVTYVPSVANK